MNRLLKGTILSFCAASLIVGCASKDVEYDGKLADKTASQQVGENTDQKAQQVAGVNEQEVNSENDLANNTNSSDVMTPTLDSIMANGINVVKSEINGESILLNSVHFAFDKFTLTDDMRQIATKNAAKIDTVAQNYSNLKVKLEGNCDEWGTDEYNYALGLKRAKTAKDALIEDGVPADKIMMVSFGESNPVCTQKNVTCWKLNRRVDYKLLP